MLDGPGGGLRDGRRDVRRTVAGQHDPGDTGTLRRAEDRAEVAGIGDAVEEQQERRRAVALGFEQILDRRRAQRLRHGEHTLGAIGAGHRLELRPGDLADRHLLLVGEIDDVVEDRSRIEIAGENHLASTAGSGHEKLPHGVTTLDLITAQVAATTTLVRRTDRGGASLPIATARSVRLPLSLTFAAALRRVLGRSAPPTLGLRLAVATASAHR